MGGGFSVSPPFHPAGDQFWNPRKYRTGCWIHKLLLLIICHSLGAGERCTRRSAMDSMPTEALPTNGREGQRCPRLPSYVPAGGLQTEAVGNAYHNLMARWPPPGARPTSLPANPFDICSLGLFLCSPLIL